MPTEAQQYQIRLREWQNAEIAEAERRAEEFLLEHLDAKQRKMWRRRDRFVIKSQQGHYYELHRGTVSNCYRLRNQRTYSHVFCGGPVGVPTADYVLAQMILLKYDEDHFLRHANVSEYD